jgi:tRNA 2-thiocytidine biosynthesis protein TtcA
MNSARPTNPARELSRRLHFLARRLSAAQRRWGLLADGDRLLLGLSGGKDSIILLHLLREWRRTGPLHFALAALHVEREGAAGNAERRRLLAAHTRTLQVELSIVRVPPADAAAGGRNIHPCFLCARRRREALLRHAAAHGFGKIVLAHHLDDDAATVLMNLLFHGRLEGLAAQRVYAGGRIALIRPLLLAEEKEIRRTAALLDFPCWTCECPDGQDSRRRQVKTFLQALGPRATAAKRRLVRAAAAQARMIHE